MSLSNFVHGSDDGWETVWYTWSEMVWNGTVSSSLFQCNRVTYQNPHNYPVYITSLTIPIGVGKGSLYSSGGSYNTYNATSIDVLFFMIQAHL